MRSVFFALAVFAVGFGCSSSDSSGTPPATTDAGSDTDTPAVVTADKAVSYTHLTLPTILLV